MTSRRALVLAAAGLAAGLSCSEAPPPDIDFPPPGSLVAPAGRGGFRFGVASSATQIEDRNTATDWYLFTLPTDQGGLGHVTFIGDAAGGYSRALEDVELLRAMHVDAYRFGIEWARIEPERGVIDEAALQHYGDLIDALLAAGITPMVTIHHFASPVWVDDPRDRDCASGPSDANLCGLGHPEGGELVIEAMAAHARLLAERFGDRVDDWGTLNEPINYLLAAYGIGQFPPGKTKLFKSLEEFVPVLRDYLEAHARMYAALKEADTVDADGDGVAAAVGVTLSVTEWVPMRDNEPSDDPEDLAARDRIVYLFHHLVPDSLLHGTFDADADGAPDEEHPDWAGTLDWLGLQYYARVGVTGKMGIFPGLDFTPCFRPLDLGSCAPPLDPTTCVPSVGFEYYPEGVYHVLMDFAGRWPDLPLAVTESGIATTLGVRRAENIVRSLEQIDRARRAGVDVRGYYHWTFYDNYEWLEGYVPRYGLYTVDRATFARTPTDGAEVLGAIAGARRLTQEQRLQYGGTGPMTPETSGPPPEYCDRQ